LAQRTEMCVHEQYRCTICDHRSEARAERAAKEARKRKPKPPTVGLPVRMDPEEKLLMEYQLRLRCLMCHELKLPICSCERQRRLNKASTEIAQFSSAAGIPLSVSKAGASTLSTLSFEMGSSLRSSGGPNGTQADEYRALANGLRM
jgi:hypothetical protein